MGLIIQVAPTYRANYKAGERAEDSSLKKGYVKEEKAEKYVYAGIP